MRMTTKPKTKNHFSFIRTCKQMENIKANKVNLKNEITKLCENRENFDEKSLFS